MQSRLQRWVIASDTQATGHLVSPPLIGPLALAQCSRARREAALRAACRKRSRLPGSWIVVWHGRAQRCSHCLKWASADRLAEQSKRVHAHPHPEIAGIQFAAPLALQATVTSSGQSSLASRVARSCELRAGGAVRRSIVLRASWTGAGRSASIFVRPVQQLLVFVPQMPRLVARSQEETGG